MKVLISTSKTLELQEIHNVQNYFTIILKYSFIYGIFFWTFNSTALIKASDNGHLEIVRELISQESIDINIKNIWITRNS